MGHQTIKITFAAAALLTALIFLIGMKHSDNTTERRVEAQVSVGNAGLVVEIANTEQEKARGFSNRDTLDMDSGMLFLFSELAVRHFWMKNMRFPIDVLWIARGSVVGLQENIPFQSDTGEVVRFESNEPADMVLEVSAGWIKEHGVSVGDMVSMR